MKTLNIIFSIYIIILTSFPCVDNYNDILVKPSHLEKSQKHNDSNDQDLDLCSPFCFCNCCNQQTLTFLDIYPLQLPILFQETEISISFYKSTLFSNFFGSIWQPPQIV